MLSVVGGHRNLTWGDIQEPINNMEASLRNLGVEMLIGISRGGLIPAVILSHRLGIPMYIVKVTSYEGSKPTDMRIDFPHHMTHRFAAAKTCFVDDIYDSGRTFQALHKILPSAHFTVLLTKDPDAPVMFADTVERRTWISFPWEL